VSERAADVMRALRHHLVPDHCNEHLDRGQTIAEVRHLNSALGNICAEIIAARQQQADERVAPSCDFLHRLPAEPLEALPLSQK
jgi:hypothetical protein